MIKKRVLDRDHTLITTPHYPWQCSADSFGHQPHKALIGVGGNIGDTVRRFEHLFWFMKRKTHCRLLESAPILRNPPFGFLEQDDFYNTLILVGTALSPRELLCKLQQIEHRFGRRRSIKDGPRTLDLDIIFYDDIQMTSRVLTIPHPGWRDRSSVLIPLKYMKGRA